MKIPQTNLLCLICGETSNDLVKIQEHVIHAHGYTVDDVRDAKRRKAMEGHSFSGSLIWTMPDGRDWLMASRKEDPDAEPLNEAELIGIARQALNLARTDRENRGWKTSILIATYFRTDEQPFHRMEMIERLLQEKLGEGWLNSGHAKDAAFGMLRMSIDFMPLTPDAIIVVTPTNMYRPAGRMKALSVEEQKRKMAGFDNSNYKQGVREGWLTCVDSFTALVQTPQLVVTATQVVGGEDPPETHCFPQEGLDGRLKMFGQSKYGYGKSKAQA